MDNSFTSTGSSRSNTSSVDAARRVNRFLSKTSPGVNSLMACNSSDSLRCVSFPFPPPESKQPMIAEGKTYVIEGIHGPVLTNKEPIGAVSKKRDYRRSRQRFKRYVAARQSERAKKFSVEDRLRTPDRSTKNEDNESYEAHHYPRCNDSPTTVMIDVSALQSKNSYEYKEAYSFVRLEKSSLKSNFNRTVGMKPKKRLTWWDDEENAHKPFLLRSDETFDDDGYDEAYSDRTLFGNSGCPHDNFKDLIEDYSDRFNMQLRALQSSVVDLFQKAESKQIGNKSLFGDNFASFSEDVVDELDVNDDGGCTGPSRQLLKVVQNMLPPVFEFEKSPPANDA